MADRISHVAEQLHSVSIRLLRGVRRMDLEAPVGPAQLSALSVLYFAPAMSLSALADAEQVSPPTMSRIVASLEAVGAVEKTADTRDARSQSIAITAPGREIFESARARRLDAVSGMLGKLSPMALGMLELVLPELTAAIAAGRDD